MSVKQGYVSINKMHSLRFHVSADRASTGDSRNTMVGKL